MPTVEPFIALRFADLLDAGTGAPPDARVVAPPYDVIDASQRTRLQADSPRNITHLTLPEGPEPAKYTHAASLLRAWRGDGSLVADASPTFTVYEQDDGAGVLRGVFAAVGLDDPTDGGVLPHERTYDTIVQDRFDLLRATECNLEPVFLLAYGAATLGELLASAVAGAPLFDVEALGVQHRAWRVDDAVTVAALQGALGGSTLVIADGHHRWRTAQRYAAEQNAGNAARAHLTFIADATTGGVRLHPIHRALPGVSPLSFLGAIDAHATVEGVDAASPDALAALVVRRREGARVYGLWANGAPSLITMRDDAPLDGPQTLAWRELDVAVLHQTLLAGLGDAMFAHSPNDAAARAGETGCAILLAPPPVTAVRAIAEAGEAMPQKSTLFVPKPASGVVLRPLDL